MLSDESLIQGPLSMKTSISVDVGIRSPSFSTVCFHGIFTLGVDCRLGGRHCHHGCIKFDDSRTNPFFDIRSSHFVRRTTTDATWHMRQKPSQAFRLKTVIVAGWLLTLTKPTNCGAKAADVLHNFFPRTLMRFH